MIESNNPEINVDELMEKVKQEVKKRQNKANITVNLDNERQVSAADSLFVSRLEALLRNAELNFSELIELPGKFNRFPLNNKIFSSLTDFLLKAYNFLFKKQRVVNQSFVDALKLIQTSLVSIESRSQIIDSRSRIVEHRNQMLVAEIKALQTELAYYKQSLTSFLQTAKNGNENPSEIKLNIDSELEHLQDAFYVAFEDRFRGTREEIRDRLGVYLPLLAKAGITSSDLILDLGCGRGEWLELLQEHNYTAKGVELNRVTIAECKSKNLEVESGDAIAYLQSLQSESVGVVTGFHLIEHLPFPQLLQLFAETIRILRPGGLAIFETPNPQNVVVGSKTFYLDPTHRNPLPSELTQFLLERTGFEPVNILYLHPCEENVRIPEKSIIAERFNEFFYGHQDYAVIGYKLSQDTDKTIVEGEQ
jgi:SAM-dependent methyltransferase